MEKKKRNFVEWAMHNRQIVILVVTCLVAFGVYSLPEMRKNEFPDFTVRQGVVVAVAPGNTAPGNGGAGYQTAGRIHFHL